ncbi:MAG TPA: PIN domain-containing protein [Burkholderiaceae bacterium]
MSLPDSEISRLTELGAPILCIDTCSVLDVMRDPTRNTSNPHNVRAALDLLNHLETGTALIGLIATQVHTELTEHLQPIHEEAEESIKRLKAQVAKVDTIASAFGATTVTDMDHLDLHVPRARQAVDRWINASILVPQGGNIPGLALARLNSAITPAKKGKDSMKDCVVIESYLDVTRTLRGAGLTTKIVFLSSNTSDYVGNSGSMLKPDLGTEFSSLNMEYAPNMGAAKFQLGL